MGRDYVPFLPDGMQGDELPCNSFSAICNVEADFSLVKSPNIVLGSDSRRVKSPNIALGSTSRRMHEGLIPAHIGGEEEVMAISTGDKVVLIASDISL